MLPDRCLLLHFLKEMPERHPKTRPVSQIKSHFFRPRSIPIFHAISIVGYGYDNGRRKRRCCYARHVSDQSQPRLIARSLEVAPSVLEFGGMEDREPIMVCNAPQPSSKNDFFTKDSHEAAHDGRI